MHRRVGVRMHQGRMPEGPRKGLLASRWDGVGGGQNPRIDGVGALGGEMGESPPNPHGSSIA
jgi:hypothetical protein